jgi:hypothetical protein
MAIDLMGELDSQNLPRGKNKHVSNRANTFGKRAKKRVKVTTEKRWQMCIQRHRIQ